MPTANIQTADLRKDLTPGPLRDELLKDFDPTQETHEEYLRRKALEDERVRLAIGGGVISGNDLGTREGFAGIRYNVQSLGGEGNEYIKTFDTKGQGKRYYLHFSRPGLSKKFTAPFTPEGLESVKKERDKIVKQFSKMTKGQGVIDPSVKQLKRPPNPKKPFLYKSPDGPKYFATKKEALDAMEEVKLKKFKSQEKPLKQSEINKVKKLLNQGKSYPQIVNETGITKNRVAKAAREIGYEFESYVDNIENRKFVKDNYGTLSRRTIGERLFPNASKSVQYDRAGKIIGDLISNKEIKAVPAALVKENIEKFGYNPDIQDAKVKAKRKKLIKQVSDLNIEFKLAALKRGEGLDQAHRLSLQQTKKTNQLYNLSNLGIDDPKVNREIIKPFENALAKEYAEQNKLVQRAKKLGTVPRDISESLSKINQNISNIIAQSDGRVQGIHIDEFTLEPKVTGVDYSKSIGMGVIDKPVKNLTQADIDYLKAALPSQLQAEKAAGIPNLKYSKVSAEVIPGGKFVAEKVMQPLADITISGVKDIAKGAIGRGALKMLPFVGTGLGVYDAGIAIQEGKDVFEVAGKLVGLDPIYTEIKKYNYLPKDAQEIQKKLNAQMSFDAAQYDAMDEGLVGLSGRPEVSAQEQMYLNEEKKKVDEKIEQENEARREGRLGLVNAIKQRIFDVSGVPYSIQFKGVDGTGFFANGGRVFLKEGGKPVNIGRRKFLKLVGQGGTLLAALPFLGKFIKPATKAAPEVIEAVSRSADQMPTYLTKLIEKIKMMGTSKIIGKYDNPDEFIRYDLGDYELFEGAGGARLKRIRDRGEYGYEEFEMQIKKDPETDFIEYEEVTARPDYDGKLKDIDFGIDDEVHLEMKKFADED